MKNFYFATFILITLSLTNAQWSSQNPFDGTLGGVFFIDDTTGWISEGPIQFIDQNTGWRCGVGIIKKTTNAGLDWKNQTGVSGISKSTNGGENWFELVTGNTEILTDLHFCNANIGYAVGLNETILKTTDGGQSWITQRSGSAYDLYSVDFVDPLVGYAVGGRDSIRFLKTTDGGLNWLEKTVEIGYMETPIINCVEFIDANVGWIGSEGSVMNHSGRISKTTDGGDTWFSNPVGRPISEETILKSEHETDNLTDPRRGIRSIYFKDSNNGYAVGGTSDGWWRRIFTTTDAGNTWQTKYASAEQTGLISVFVTSGGKGWAVGYAGVIYTTEDNGFSWSQILSGSQGSWTGDWITSVFMVNDSVGWAAGFRKGYLYYKIILKTTNGGKIWKTNFQVDQTAQRTKANVFFINENIGWVSYQNKLSYKTTDGGNNWFSSGIGAAENFFLNQDTGWATHTISGVYKTTNGGNDWMNKSSVRSHSIYFSDMNNGWVVGEGGNIMKSTNVGESWITKPSGISSDLNSVSFYNNVVGICVGNFGKVLLSTDGGENWDSKTLGSSATLNSVTFTNANTAWIAGSEGTILRTTDLGNSWISYPGIEGNITSLFFLNENKGWAADGGSKIYTYLLKPEPPEKHFTPIWSGTPLLAMNIQVTGVSLQNGATLNAGDEIGIFDGNHCVGSIVLTGPIGSFLSIIASTDNPNTANIDGFTTGNKISYKFWLAASATEIITYNIEYIQGDGTFVSQGIAVVAFESVLPVELTSFTASLNNYTVNLKWVTATEVNNFGFEIERNQDGHWQKIGFVAGNGNSNSPRGYSFTDFKFVNGNKFNYRLKQIDNDGHFEYSNVVEVENIPTEFVIYQNYPNPFNPSTTIRYQLPSKSKVIIKIYNILGSEVMELLNEQKEPGVYEIAFNPDNLSSGTYFYRIIADKFDQTKKMILIK